MSLTVAVQMDPSGINIAGDSTLRADALGAGARAPAVPLRRDARCAGTDGRITRAGRAGARCSGSRAITSRFEASPARSTSARDIDVVLMRQDPPFDLGYITATHAARAAQGRDAGGQRPAQRPQRAREDVRARLRAVHAADAGHAPARRRARVPARNTARSWSSRSTATAARRSSRSRPTAPTSRALIELFDQVWPEPFMVQPFLPEVAEGDKRIVLVDGEVAGAINRKPGEGEFRSNLAVGGSAEATDADRARGGNLRRARAGAQAARAGLRRHRRDRRRSG